MSVDLHDELTRAAPEPNREVDLSVVRRRARQLHRRRAGGAVAVAVTLVALGVLGLEQLPGDEQTAPVVGPAPTGIDDSPRPVEPSPTGIAEPTDVDEEGSTRPSDPTSRLEQEREALEAQIQEATTALAQLRTVESELRAREDDGENVDDEQEALADEFDAVRRRIEDLADTRLAVERQLHELGALEDPVSIARAAVTEDDRALADALMAFAAGPQASTARTVPFASSVELGLGPELARQVDAADMADPSAWVFEAALFRARDGDLSALELLRQDRVVQVLVGDHPHCASPPMPAPAGYEQHRRVSLQPIDITSCIEWWTVDLFLDDGMVAAVTLDLWEP